MSERTFLIQQRPLIFEGQSQWNAPPARDVQISPPPPFVVSLDRAKRQLPSDGPTKKPATRLADNPNLELRRDSHGKLRWQLTEAVVDEIRGCLLAGEPPRTIVKRMGVGVKQVYVIRGELGIKTPPVRDRELPPEVAGLSVADTVQALIARGWRNREVANALLVSESYVCVVKHRTLLASASAAESEAQLQPEIAPSATPVAPAPPMVLPATPEPPRTYTLDWRDRMNAWRFEDAYVHPRPRHKVNSATRTQIMDAVHVRPGLPIEINCRPPRRPARRALAQSIAEKPTTNPFA